MSAEKIIFKKLPETLEELKVFPEATLNSPFKTAALTLAALSRYEENPETTIEMLNFLKGPENVSEYEKQFLRERLSGKQYKVRSFFEGAAPQNGYQPTQPYSITVSDNPYSYPDENWATLYVKSSGADTARGIKLRRKPSTGQWFLNEIQCLSDIRVPVEEDPWA